VLTVAAEECEWLHLFDTFDGLDLDKKWSVDFWLVNGSHGVKLPAFEPGRHVDVRRVSSDSIPFWVERLTPKKVLRDDFEAGVIRDAEVEEPEEYLSEVGSILDEGEAWREESDEDVPEPPWPPRPPVPPVPPEPAPAPPVPLPLPPPVVGDGPIVVARGRGRGIARGRGRGGMPYSHVLVSRVDDPDIVLGIIKLNDHSSSLDVTCVRCNHGFDRKYKQHPTHFNTPGKSKSQGRPMGSHLAWLEMECCGDPNDHKARWNNADLPRDRRIDCRQRYSDACQFGDWPLIWSRERKPWGDELRDPDTLG
jgi:hypothetical protein